MSTKIIVPYRDTSDGLRAQHLTRFLNHFESLQWDMPIYIVEQAGTDKFNRGALLNIGAACFCKEGDTLIFHDVDLLPHESLKDLYLNAAKPRVATHLGSLWTTKYSFATFFGGAVSLSYTDFKAANGFPNQCWGWGGEDDILLNRLLKTGTTIARPTPENGVSLYQELPHPHQGNAQETKNMHRWEDVDFYSKSLKDGLSTVDSIYEPLHHMTTSRNGARLLVNLDHLPPV